jgi:hypothetical protein
VTSVVAGRLVGFDGSVGVHFRPLSVSFVVIIFIITLFILQGGHVRGCLWSTGFGEHSRLLKEGGKGLQTFLCAKQL